MVSPISSPRDAVGVSLLGDKLYAVGGYDGQQLNDVECYDPQTNEWNKVTAYLGSLTLNSISCEDFIVHSNTGLVYLCQKILFGATKPRFGSLIQAMRDSQFDECR